MFGRRNSSKGGLLKRLIRSIFSIFIITAFLVALSLGIKQLSSFDVEEFSTTIGKIASKVGLSEDRVGDVAGTFVKRVTDVSIQPSAQQDLPEVSSASDVREVEKKPEITRQSVLKIAIMSDIHDDLAGLSSAIFKTEEEKLEKLFLLGDLTDFGVLDNLNLVKNELDASGLEFYALPGDHDLYKTVGPQNFLEVFGTANRVVTYNNVKVLMLDNSANFTPISEDTMRWFNAEVASADFVLLAQPIYQKNVSVLSPVMGIVNGEENKEVKAQGELILSMIRDSGVKAVIAGDHHRSSDTVDPVRPDLNHIVVGAINSYRNLQSERFSVLEVFSDDTYKIDEILLD